MAQTLQRVGHAVEVLPTQAYAHQVPEGWSTKGNRRRWQHVDVDAWRAEVARRRRLAVTPRGCRDADYCAVCGVTKTMHRWYSNGPDNRVICGECFKDWQAGGRSAYSEAWADIAASRCFQLSGPTMGIGEASSWQPYYKVAGPDSAGHPEPWGYIVGYAEMRQKLWRHYQSLAPSWFRESLEFERRLAAMKARAKARASAGTLDLTEST